jgi:hypothetical protein
MQNPYSEEQGISGKEQGIAKWHQRISGVAPHQQRKR